MLKKSLDFFFFNKKWKGSSLERKIVLFFLLFTLFSLYLDFVWTYDYHSLFKDEEGDKNPTWKVLGNWQLGVFLKSSLYFTNQSNLLLVIFYYFFLVKKPLVKKPIYQIAFTIYISLTMIMYWIFLFPAVIKDNGFVSALLKNEYYSLAYFFVIDVTLLHAVTPLMFFVFYFLSLAGDKEISVSSFIKKDFQKINVYPLLYFLFSFIFSRSFLYKNNKGVSNYLVLYMPIFGYEDGDDLFNLQIIIAFFSMAFILLFFCIFFIWFNNFKFFKTTNNINTFQATKQKINYPF